MKQYYKIVFLYLTILSSFSLFLSIIFQSSIESFKQNTAAARAKLFTMHVLSHIHRCVLVCNPKLPFLVTYANMKNVFRRHRFHH